MTTTHHIYGAIGDLGNTPGDIAAALKAAGTKPVNVRINSPGGSAFDGIAIYNLLAQHKPGVTIDIDGIAASAASVIAMAGSKIRMSESGLLMIHDPSGITAGTAADHESTSGVLAKIGESLATIYSNRTGIDRATIASMMADETWLNPADALAQKFIDEIVPAQRVAASFDLSPFKYRKAPTAMTITPPTTDEFTRGYEAARNHIAAALKEFPSEPQFIIDQFIAGRSLGEAKAIHAEITKATATQAAAIKAQQKEIDRLKAIAGTQGPVDTGVTRGGSYFNEADDRNDLPIEEQAAQEFKADASLRKTFTNEKSYVAFRAAQAAGRINVFGRPKVDPLARV